MKLISRTENDVHIESLPPIVDEMKVIRKIDMRIIPIQSLLYLMFFLDRGSIGNANIEGLSTDLKLTGAQCNMCRTVFCRRDIPFRTAMFFSAASVAGAFSGLLAFAIAKIDGVGALERWRWIFILEGIATVVVVILSFWLVVDFPDTRL